MRYKALRRSSARRRPHSRSMKIDVKAEPRHV
jgi:hypothetical protein